MAQSSLLRGGKTTSKQRCAWNMWDVWHCEANGLMGQVISSVKPILHTAGVRLPTLSSLLQFSHAPPQTCLLQIDALIDQLGEWPFYYPLKIRRDFFFLLKCFWVCISFAVVWRLFRFWGVVFWVPSGGDIPQEAIMVHDYCDHRCGMAQLWEQLWLINQSFWSGTGGGHTINRASLHQKEPCFIWNKIFKVANL